MNKRLVLIIVTLTILIIGFAYADGLGCGAVCDPDADEECTGECPCQEVDGEWLCGTPGSGILPEDRPDDDAIEVLNCDDPCDPTDPNTKCPERCSKCAFGAHLTGDSLGYTCRGETPEPERGDIDPGQAPEACGKKCNPDEKDACPNLCPCEKIDFTGLSEYFCGATRGYEKQITLLQPDGSLNYQLLAELTEKHGGKVPGFTKLFGNKKMNLALIDKGEKKVYGFSFDEKAKINAMQEAKYEGKAWEIEIKKETIESIENSPDQLAALITYIEDKTIKVSSVGIPLLWQGVVKTAAALTKNPFVEVKKGKKVPTTYNGKKAFILHSNGGLITIDTGGKNLIAVNKVGAPKGYATPLSQIVNVKQNAGVYLVKTSQYNSYWDTNPKPIIEKNNGFKALNIAPQCLATCAYGGNVGLW